MAKHSESPEFLVVHATGPNHADCKRRFNQQAEDIGNGFSTLAVGCAVARYPERRGVDLFAPVGEKCLRVVIRGSNQAQCDERLVTFNQLLQADATEFPDWVVEISWNHGGGGGP